jgi:uncharacterized protein (DUF58 family)
MTRFDPQTFADASGLAVKARIIVDGALSGYHRARMHGSSVEFASHKEYSHGDEIRHIDWRTYAKNDRYYVKQFEQESELTAHLILDASASMVYGEGVEQKLAYGATMVAALAYLLSQQGDKVGLLAFGENTHETYLPPRSRPAHFSDIIDVLEALLKRGGRGDESLSAALERSAELLQKRRSLILLVSDCFDAGGHLPSFLTQLRARGHDVSLFHVLHADELTLPFQGLTQFEALESRRNLLAHPATVRREYQRKLREFLHGIEQVCTDHAIDYHAAPSNRPFDELLIRFLSARDRSANAPRPEVSWAL